MEPLTKLKQGKINLKPKLQVRESLPPLPLLKARWGRRGQNGRGPHRGGVREELRGQHSWCPWGLLLSPSTATSRQGLRWGSWWAERRIGEGGMGGYFSLLATAHWGPTLRCQSTRKLIFESLGSSASDRSLELASRAPW